VAKAPQVEGSKKRGRRQKRKGIKKVGGCIKRSRFNRGKTTRRRHTTTTNVWKKREERGVQTKGGGVFN